MSRRYLGPEFDIHGGGLDLRFPHHENELAQSTAAGDAFARYWVHNGLVTVGDQKMSKSLGNFLLAEDVLAEYDPLVVRYALLAAHYRSNLDLSPSTFTEADAALGRVESFLLRVLRATDSDPSVLQPGAVPEAFADAMDDDLGVPGALAVLHDTVRRGNTALDAGELTDAIAHRRSVVAMMDVLGLPTDGTAVANGVDGASAALDRLVTTMIDQRADARATKDWATADRIRDAIAAAGVVLEDGPEGTHWSLNNG
jgi:cysteinyl-tRNA synthetase